MVSSHPDDYTRQITSPFSLTTADAAHLVGVTPTTVEAWIDHQLLPAERGPDGWRVAPMDLAIAKALATGTDICAGVESDDHLLGERPGPVVGEPSLSGQPGAVAMLRSTCVERLTAMRRTYLDWIAERERIITAMQETIVELQHRVERAEARVREVSRERRFRERGHDVNRRR